MSAQPQSDHGSRPDAARSSNEHIADRAVELRFVSRIPLLCECSDASCRQLVLLTVDDYREARRDADYLTAPGHAVEGAAPDRRAADHVLHRRV